MVKGNFTEQYPDKNYKPTTDSTHPQSKFWPEYLPVQDTRMFIFERSKNAQLVVYTANYKDKEKLTIDPKWPLDINWQSYGWTDYPTSNSTGMLERKMAWGYKHVQVDDDNNETRDGIKYEITLSAMTDRKAYFYQDKDGLPHLELQISGKNSKLQKVFVQTEDTAKFIPKVLFVELYGKDIETGEDAYEKHIVT